MTKTAPSRKTIVVTRKTEAAQAKASRKKTSVRKAIGASSASASASAIELRLRTLESPKDAQILARFFKTGPGEYGEGDVFLGVKVPAQRAIAKDMVGVPSAELADLLRSPIHEVRLTALLTLVLKFGKADEGERERIVKLYLKNAKRINNWDLVDSSAPYILGEYLFDKDKKPLYELVRSKNLWERRIGIVATHGLIRRGDDGVALALSARLLRDDEDLMHKAVGWTLREAGKRVSRENLLAFLDEYAPKMPRTALRYAIEHLSPKERREYLEMPSEKLVRRRH